MTNAILTPLTQALAEGKLSRGDLRSLMQRSNRPALLRLLVWVGLLALTSTLITFSFNSLWIWPAMFVQGIVLVHHFSLQHECVHYSVFRTRWLNDLVGNICGFIIMLPHKHFRYEHCDHHTYTQLPGDDPELIPTPETIGQYLFYLTAIPYWRTKFTELFRHVGGHLSAQKSGLCHGSNRVRAGWRSTTHRAGFMCRWRCAPTAGRICVTGILTAISSNARCIRARLTCATGGARRLAVKLIPESRNI